MILKNPCIDCIVLAMCKSKLSGCTDIDHLISELEILSRDCPSLFKHIMEFVETGPYGNKLSYYSLDDTKALEIINSIMTRENM